MVRLLHLQGHYFIFLGWKILVGNLESFLIIILYFALAYEDLLKILDSRSDMIGGIVINEVFHFIRKWTSTRHSIIFGCFKTTLHPGMEGNPTAIIKVPMNTSRNAKIEMEKVN